MKAVLIAPRKYVQGRGVLKEIGTYLALLGKRPLLLWDACVKGLVGDLVLASVRQAGLEPVEVAFNGESTKEEANRVAQIARDKAADIAVGIGGGKTLDTAKAAAVYAGLKMVTVPTIASNDSPTSAASVWYDAEGNCTGWDCWPFNPDIVLVDSQVIANAPVRAFVAGMGDALATWLEAEAAYKTRAVNLAGGVPTMAGMALARLCFDTLMEYGIEAKRALELHVVTPAVEKVIEANVLLSGLGFESGGLATAHMIANALPSFPECKRFMHGEKVGFGIISQLCLDDEVNTDEMYEIVDFEIAIGLPVTFADLNLEGIGRERLRQIGDICAGDNSLCKNHPFKVTSDDVVDAMIAADALGRRRKEVALGG
ncbi:MAG: glycerol dehydrogenase [Thermoguttaceae bacterium]|jgi:glycerol dehydrogenase|nr:glycerol dehydrogenase [Thermoguttaceae bacterium]